MTELLEKAFAEASKLPQEAQDMLAKMLLDDLAAEEKWDETFARSQDRLARLADEALAEYQSVRAGE
ncbi:MAG: hypothetical protein ACR2G4_03600 [Pyrinomonadaceae bacterium]